MYNVFEKSRVLVQSPENNERGKKYYCYGIQKQRTLVAAKSSFANITTLSHALYSSKILGREWLHGRQPYWKPGYTFHYHTAVLYEPNSHSYPHSGAKL